MKLGELIDKFEACNTEEEVKELYKYLWNVTEKAIAEEENIKIGDNRPFGKTYDRIRSNMSYLIGRISESSENQAQLIQKTLWFL